MQKHDSTQDGTWTKKSNKREVLNKWIQNIDEKIIFKLILESKQNVLKVNIC